MTSLRMRTKRDVNSAVATVKCIIYKASASARASWLPRTGLDFDYNRADSANPNQRDQTTISLIRR